MQRYAVGHSHESEKSACGAQWWSSVPSAPQRSHRGFSPWYYLPLFALLAWTATLSLMLAFPLSRPRRAPHRRA
jgi:hypothetical protein